MNSVGKSDFGGLVRYLTDAQGKNERVGAVLVTNCHSDNWRFAITEVLNTQAQNTRSVSDKTYHLIVSFRAGEQLEEATLRAIEARICDGLGYGEHQRVSVMHHDTDNLHFHIAINKIHPKRYTLHDPYRDYRIRDQLCRQLEREYGLEVDNHQVQKTGSENRAADMEHHAGIQSLLGWIQRGCGEQVKSAQSWADLHAVLHSNGLELLERGNGLVIVNGEGLGVKASSVARDLSKTKLEQRLGTFEARLPGPAWTVVNQAAQAKRVQSPPVGKVGNIPPPRSQNRHHTLSQLASIQIDSGRRYEAQPTRSRINTNELYARYKGTQQSTHSIRTEEWAKALERKNRMLATAKRHAELKRGAIKAVKGAGLGKKVLYGAVRKTLIEEVAKAVTQYQADRQAIRDSYRPLTWADWLRARATAGDQDALMALRAREASQGLKGNTLAGLIGNKFMAVHPASDSITKKGTVIYRFGQTAVRDDGDRLKVSRGADQDGLQAALRLAMQRYGDHITVNGTDAFKEQIAKVAATARLPITFADAALELRRQTLLRQPKENADENERTRANRGRTDSRSNGGHGLFATGVNPSAAARARSSQPGAGRGRPVSATGFHGKPDVGRVGRKPPPQSKNRLRDLSELGVVQLTGGSQVLLPRDVPGHLEQQGSKPDHGLRRHLFGAGSVTLGQIEADRYIAERNSKRPKIFDIKKHTRYNLNHDGVDAFAGIRQINGQMLALLERGEEVMVLPVDEATAHRLKRVAIGHHISVGPNGSLKIKTKGDSIAPKGRGR